MSVFKTLKSIGEQKKQEQISSEIPVERFQPFVLLGLLALLFNQLTLSRVRGVSNLSSLILILPFFYFGGCLKQDNIRRAEEAAKDNNWNEAAKNYEIELNASAEMSSATKAKILLNTGLAYAQAGRLEQAKERLQEAIDQSLDSPKLQSQALNELGKPFLPEDKSVAGPAKCNASQNKLGAVPQILRVCHRIRWKSQCRG